MGPLAAAGIKAGASLLSGLLGRKKEGPSIAKQYNMARKGQRDLEKNRYKWLVQGAQSAGFNPLTVLGATGGQMAPLPGVSAPLARESVAQIAGSALASGAHAYLTHDPIAKESAELDVEMKREQLEALRNERQRYGVPSVQTTQSPVEDYGPPLNIESSAPPIRPHPTKQARVPVYLPGQSNRQNSPVMLLKNIADRLGVKNFETLTVGDVAEIAGEGTEIAAAADISDILDGLLKTGIFTNYKDQERKKQIRDEEMKQLTDDLVQP